MNDLIKTQVDVIIDASDKPKLDEQIDIKDIIYTLITMILSSILIYITNNNTMAIIISIIGAMIILVIACRYQDRQEEFDKSYEVKAELTISKYKETVNIIIITELKDRIQINLDKLMTNRKNKCIYDYRRSLLIIKSKDIKCYVNHQLIKCGIKIKCKKDKLLFLLENLGYNIKYIEN